MSYRITTADLAEITSKINAVENATDLVWTVEVEERPRKGTLGDERFLVFKTSDRTLCIAGSVSRGYDVETGQVTRRGLDFDTAVTHMGFLVTKMSKF